jgi:hypothetical protein
MKYLSQKRIHIQLAASFVTEAPDAVAAAATDAAEQEK